MITNTTFLLTESRIYDILIKVIIMLSFVWNGIEWLLADIGGGELTGEISAHTHSKNSYELHFITGGSGELITENGAYKLAKNDFFVTGPYISHAHKSNASEPLTDIFIYIQKKENSRPNTFGKAFLDKNFFFLRNYSNTAAVKIFGEYSEKRSDWQSAVSGLMMYLLTDITRLYAPDGNDNYTSREDINTENLNDKRFVIIENEFLYNKNITLGGLSEKIGLCERQTQRLLLKYYGSNFREKKKKSSQIS